MAAAAPPASAPPPETGLKRRLGTGLLTLYGVGVMVGAGIYLLVGVVAGAAGAWAPAAFLVAGLIALPTALAYAELSGRVPEAAGEAAYLRVATGRAAPAAAVGLAIEVVGIVSAAVVLQGGVGYLLAILPAPEAALAVGFGAVLGLAAAWGVLESLTLAALFTLAEVAGLAIVAVVGLAWGGAAAAPPAATAGADALALGGVLAGAVLAFFAFLGFEDMVNMVEETREPARRMPRAILAALALTTVLYLLVAWAAVRTVPPAALAESRRPLALVYETATGRGPVFLSLIAVAAALNGVLAQIVMSARVLYGLGRFVPGLGVFHHAHPRLGTPLRATALVTVAIVVLALTLPLEALAELSSLILLAVFMAINAALFVLKRRGPAPEGCFSAPRIAPVAGFLLSGLALAWGVTR
jgi:amino acid transporter